MKRWSSYIFIFIFIANALAIGIMSVWYTTDKEYFTNNFCVNKEKISLQCNGRCHLKKQISGNTETNKKKEISIPVLEFEFIVTNKQISNTRPYSIIVKNKTNNYFSAYKAPYLETKHHPPIG